MKELKVGDIFFSSSIYSNIKITRIDTINKTVKFRRMSKPSHKKRCRILTEIPISNFHRGLDCSDFRSILEV